VGRVPGYGTEMYCVSCEVRTEIIYVNVKQKKVETTLPEGLAGNAWEPSKYKIFPFSYSFLAVPFTAPTLKFYFYLSLSRSQ
jgi:hypothetical protein